MGTTGIVHLEELPQEKLYVAFQSSFLESLDKQIREIGIFELARLLNISKRIVNHWLAEGTLIRLDVLVKICRYFQLDYSSHISYLRGKSGGKIYPHLPFDFTSEEGVRVIAAILGDGGISVKKTCTYSNSNKDLTDGFLQDIKYVFGKVECTSWFVQKKNGPVLNVSLPAILSEVFFLLGLQAGKKVEINPNIPEFIFALPDQHKYTYLSQFIDDEGTINVIAKHISLTSSCLQKYGTPHLLKDLQKLILPLDILCSIYPGKIYSSKRGEPRRVWKLQINGSLQLNKLCEHLKIRSVKKKEKLHQLINSYQLVTFRRRDILETYINFMRKIQNVQGHFTSQDLADEAGRAVGTCANTIAKYKKSGVVACIQPLILTSNGAQFGKYILDPLI